MLLDFQAGRPMETGAILGNAVSAAQRVGFAVPRLETIYRLMRLREQAIQTQSGAITDRT
jgi:2-dehydropantoate 2-reductase